MRVDLESFRNIFLEEAQAHVETMEAELLELLFDPASPDRLDALFRGAHSIKGGAGMFGFTAIAELSHALETVMDAVRSGDQVVDRALVDALLGGVDCVKELLAGLGIDGITSPEADGRVSRTMAALQAFLTDHSHGPAPASGAHQLVSDEASTAQPAHAAPVQPGAGADESLSPSTAPDTVSGATAGGFRESASIRVGIDKIDVLMNLVGELVITQSMLGQMGDELESCGPERLLNGIAQLERHTRELQENVMKIRMLPISNVFNRLPRLVHDLSARLGKVLDLEVSGEETEVDKTVLERIGDPLVHLVRNAIDHGIERPEDRLAAGKPRRGRLALRAFHANGNIVVEVSDDGAGLNAARILERARQSGLVGDDSRLSDQKLKELVFHPGFSTADDVTDVSGRGVGMDVVRNNVESLGGMVDLASRPGAGSTFTIRLPLTLAIIDGQLIRVGHRVFVVPLVSILESLQVDPADLRSVGRRTSVYQLRGDYVPVVALTELFGVPPGDDQRLEPLLMVLEAGGEKIGLLVDDLLTQQQVVIKSMESNFRRIEGVAGATILGDGTVSMILDIPGLLSLARARKGRAPDQSLDHQAA